MFQCLRPWFWYFIGDEFVECVLSSPLSKSFNVSKSMKFSLWKESARRKGANTACIMEIGSIKQNLELGCIGRVSLISILILARHIYWKSVAKYNPLPKKFNITKLKNKTLTFDPTHWLLQNERLFKCLQLGQSLGHPININIFSPSPFEVHPIFYICWAFPPQEVISMDTLCWMKNSLQIVWTRVWVNVNMIRMQWPPWGLIKGNNYFSLATS